MSETRFADAPAAAAALRRMTMAEIRSLLAVKSAGNLTRAALDLGVSQPALSQHIRELENKLGVVLFQRHRRGLDPTPYGTVLLRLAAAMHVDLRIAAEELVLAEREVGSPIRIGSMAVTSGGVLAIALSRFASESQNPSVVLLEGPRELLLEHLRHRRIDLFIGRLIDDDATADLRSELLLLDSAVVISATRHPLARRTRLDMRALKPYAWILPAEDTSFHQQIAQAMRQTGHPMPVARIRSYSMLAFPAIVSTSNMLGFLPTSLFAAGTLSGGLQRLPVDLDWTPSPIGIVTRPDSDRKDDLENLVKVLRAVAASAKNATLAR